jgi:hypothetical protein
MRGGSDSNIIAVTYCSGNRSRGGRREYAEVQLYVEGEGVGCFDRVLSSGREMDSSRGSMHLSKKSSNRRQARGRGSGTVMSSYLVSVIPPWYCKPQWEILE